ncbi:hypothetical protein AB0346_22985 [Nocardia beijingensis]|uniref:hypothetical protein n=1 Tax=Nocardia beijingensis TaxID=95162 RepID=UPI00344DA3D9
MEMRNGVWSSQTRADDVRDIQRWAKKITTTSTDPEVQRLAEKIRRAADDLERELR